MFGPINERASGAQPVYLKPETFFTIAAVALAAYVILVTFDGMRYFRR